MAEQGNIAASHQKELDSLKEKDPEFYEFLKEEDASLLDFDGGDLPPLSDDSDLSEGDEEEDSSIVEDFDVDSSGDDDDGQQTGKSKKKKKEIVKITEEMVNKWKNVLMSAEPTVSSLRKLVGAFSAAVINIDDGGQTKEEKTKKKHVQKRNILITNFKVTEASVFNSVVGACVQCVPTVLAKILDYHPEKMKKGKKTPLPSACQRWFSVKPFIRDYLVKAIRLLDLVVDESVKRIFLRHLLVMSHYFITFPKLARAILKMLIRMWSTDENESLRVLAFFFILRIIKLDRRRYLEKSLQRCYMAYVSNCKFTSPSTLPMINFMQQTFTELCALDSTVTYNYAFVYIRQLAIHLRKAVINRKKENIQTIYNWQFVHSIGLWSRALATLYPNHVLQPLLYPLIQVAIGAVELVQVKRYYPLRFRIVQYLITLGDASNTFIPLLSLITAPLLLNELRMKPHGKFGAPVIFSTMLKFSNAQMEQGSTRDAIIDQVYDLLMSFVNSQAHTIAYPELVVPLLSTLRKFTKECKHSNYSKVMKKLAEMLKENEVYIKEKRAKVNFDVTNVEAVNSWEKSAREEGVPFFAHYNEYRKKRERELINQISSKDAVVDERIPTVDHARFKDRFKQDDKQEFADLFEGDEDYTESFKKVLEDGGNINPNKKRPKKKDFIRQENDDVTDDVEMDDIADEVVAEKPAPKLKKKKRTKVKVGGKGPKDIVGDLKLSDIE